MALFNKIKDPVEGTARVVGCSQQSTEDAAFLPTQCRMNLVLEAPGVAPVAVEKVKFVPGEKHPRPGMVLPVTFDRNRPERFEILWDQVPSHQQVTRDRARQQAEALAAADSGFEDSPAGGVAEQLGELFPGAHIEVEGSIGLDDLPAGTVDAIRSALGAAAAPAPPSEATGADDRLTHLERLAGLHASGALSDEEFAAEKRRLLEP